MHGIDWTELGDPGGQSGYVVPQPVRPGTPGAGVVFAVGRDVDRNRARTARGEGRPFDSCSCTAVVAEPRRSPVDGGEHDSCGGVATSIAQQRKVVGLALHVADSRSRVREGEGCELMCIAIAND